MPRSASQLESVVKAVDPTRYPSPDDFVRTVLAALGAFLPPGSVWETLELHGFDSGWVPFDADEATYRASQGNPVVVGSRHHVAVVLPSRMGDEPRIAFGGLVPRARAPLAAGFGQTPVSYWGRP
jgi:hypothetical protein